MTLIRTNNAGRTEPYLSAYLNSKGVARGIPVNGTFELTARCNFDCKMCYVHLKNTEELIPKELSTEEWIKIGKAARDAGLLFLLLTGGEPFLRPDFKELYTAFVQMGFVVSINTNASLYNEELRELFKKYPPSRLNVTLYGASEDTYKNLCGHASFEKVMKNLRLMKEDGLSVRLNVSITKWNIGDLDAIERISRELGMHAKMSAYMYPPVRVSGEIGDNAGRLTAEEAGAALARWRYLQDTKDMLHLRAEKIRACEAADSGNECIDTEAEGEGIRCRAGRSSFWLTWDGRLLPCGTMNAEGTDVRTVGFSGAWEACKAEAAEIRLPKECTNCPYRNNCSVCASICAGETGAYGTKPEYVCRMTETMCREILRYDHENSV